MPLVISLMILMELIAYKLDLDVDHSASGLLTGWYLSGLTGKHEMMIVFCAVILLDAIINVVVLALYFSKLNNLILAKQRTNRMISGQELEMNETQRVFVHKVVKHSLLCLVSFGTTQMVWYYSLVTFWVDDYRTYPSYYVVIMNGLVTVTCIFFTYKFNDAAYYKCCGCCHQRLFQYCRRRANQKLAVNPIAC